GIPEQPDAIPRLLISALVWTGESNVYDVPDNLITLQQMTYDSSKEYPGSLKTLEQWAGLWRGNSRFSRRGVFRPARGFEGFDHKLANIENATHLHPQLDGHPPSSGQGAGLTGPGEGYLQYRRAPTAGQRQ
ncbi:MAG: hypothetical protein VB858_11070, partial [Planctomycetaceae bacterium]